MFLNIYVHGERKKFTHTLSKGKLKKKMTNKERIKTEKKISKKINTHEGQSIKGRIL